LYGNLIVPNGQGLCYFYWANALILLGLTGLNGLRSLSNLIYIPIIHRVFPVTFIVGMFMMAALMSMAQLFLRRSTTWLYGIWFCLYYEAVLLWQMPVAWFTFWKSTWGTRMTPADIAEANKQKERKYDSA